MKIRILLIALLLVIGSSTTSAQVLINADNVMNGQTNQWFLNPNGNALSQALYIPVDTSTQLTVTSLGHDMSVSPFTAAMQFIVPAGQSYNFQDASGNVVVRFANRANINADAAGDVDFVTTSLYIQTDLGQAVTINGATTPFTGILELGANGSYLSGGSDGSIHTSALSIDTGGIVQFQDLTNAHSTNVFESTDGLHLKPSSLGLGFKIMDNTNTHGTSLSQSPTVFTINSGGTAIGLQTSGANINLYGPLLSNEWSAYNVPYLDSSGIMQSSPLFENQVMMGNSLEYPTPTTITAGTNITLDTSVDGVMTINSTGDGGITTVTATSPLVSTPITGGFDISCGAGQCGLYDGGGNQFYSAGKYTNYSDPTSVYSSGIFQTSSGLTVQSNNAGLGFRIIDSTNTHGTTLIQDSTDFTISSGNSTNLILQSSGSTGIVLNSNFKVDPGGNTNVMFGSVLNIWDSSNVYSTNVQQVGTGLHITSGIGSGATTYLNTQLNNSNWSTNQVLYSDSSSNAQSLALSGGQFLTANSSGVPIAGNYVEGPGITISNDGLGNTTFSAPSNLTETNTAVACEFNGGSSSGTTDFTMIFNFKRIGSLVYVQIPEGGVIVPGASPVTFLTSASANPGCIPSFLLPTNIIVQEIVTSSDGIVPAGQPGIIQIDNTGNITIYYQVSGGGFPAGLLGSTGYGQSGTVTWSQQMGYSTRSGVPAHTVTGSGTNGTVTPTPQYWLPGVTASLTFNLDPNVGFVLDTATDTCNGGSPGGSIVGGTYVVTTTTQSCAVSAVFIAEPSGTYTVSSFGLNSSVSPLSASWITGTTTQLDFTVNRFAGRQLSTITDDCNSGGVGGSLIGNIYRVTTVTANCTINLLANDYLKVSYLDFTASGSLAVIPNGAFAIPNLIAFGFAAPSATALTTPQLNAVVNAIANETVGTKNFLSIGGATYSHANFVSVGFSTAITNALSIVTQINGAAANPIDGIDLDLEGTGWNPTDIQTLITGFHGAGLLVSCTPQLYYTGSSNVNPVSPTNLILTAGGGTGNTFGTAAAAGECDYIFAQTYNSGGWTIGSAGEGTTEFFAKAAQALSNTVQASCSGPTPLCIKSGTKIAIGNVANAGAGGSGPGAPTMFNPTAAQIAPSPPYSIPTYNQPAVLSSYVSYITPSLTAYPSISGMMMFSINNDYAPLLYNASDVAPTAAGNFSNSIYGVDL